MSTDSSEQIEWLSPVWKSLVANRMIADQLSHAFLYINLHKIYTDSAMDVFIYQFLNPAVTVTIMKNCNQDLTERNSNFGGFYAKGHWPTQGHALLEIVFEEQSPDSSVHS